LKNYFILKPSTLIVFNAKDWLTVENINYQYKMELNHVRLVQVLCVAEYLVQRPCRKHWVHPINDDRETRERFSTFYNDIRLYPEKFFIYYRKSIKTFDELLQKVRD